MRVLFAIIIGLTVPAGASTEIKVAITFDDLPAAGPQGKLSRKTVSDKIIKILAQHNLTGVYGFVNGNLATGMTERLQILSDWKRARHKVGNHTYSHDALTAIKAEDYIAQIEKNESLLIDYANSIPELKVFRYTFLEEGETQDKRYAVRSYLKRRQYLIAPVTVDFSDWKWLEPYLRCEKSGNAQGLEMLKQSYLDAADKSLSFSSKLARDMLGRPISHVLLLHYSALTAEILHDLIEKFKTKGVQFISLQEALKDPFYAADTTYIGPAGLSQLLQHAQTTGYQLHKRPQFPTLDFVCK